METVLPDEREGPMAPQLGMGTFQIKDENNKVVGYATSNYNNHCNYPNQPVKSSSYELWALSKKDYHWPSAGHASVKLEFVYVNSTVLDLAGFCALLGTPADYCIRCHQITTVSCPPAPSGKG